MGTLLWCCCRWWGIFGMGIKAKLLFGFSSAARIPMGYRCHQVL